ncbi:MAG TPA: hypothetical protein VFF77_04920 [Holophagaceae bacterium]|nr:hypothetical protein [Holophagaceae bacterium]
MAGGLIVDVDPKALNPLFLELTGKLVDVLTGQGYIVATDRTRGWRRHQLFRFFCGDDTFARLVRIEVVVSGETRYRITPKGGEDEIQLDGLIPEGAAFEIRLVRAPQLVIAALPSPMPDVDLRLEAFG